MNKTTTIEQPTVPSFLMGGGEMGRLTREFNWSDTALGPPSEWPQSLKTTLGIILKSKFPMFLWWGPDLLCFYNDAYRPSLGNTGKHPAILGMPAAKAWSEIWDFIGPLIQRVQKNSESVFHEDLLLPIFRNGQMEDVYWTFSYSPVEDDSGDVAGVLVTCHEMTSKVQMLRHLETAHEQLRLSKEAAQLGMFDMDLLKGTMEWDKRCRTLFGISHEDVVTYEHDFVNGLHPEDKERITAIITGLFDKHSGGEYDVEYRTIGVDDGRIRWVRAKGQVYFDRQDKPVRFIGSVLDITLKKIDEQRKNDFIAIISHELKTPLTSLGAYIQVLLREFPDNSGFIYDLLARANVQTKKMTVLINGFLNLSRFELGKLETVVTTFHMDELVQETIADLRATQENLVIDFLPCHAIEVAADKNKIGSVISNLLSNAVKYSAPGGRIVVTCTRNAGLVTIAVADQGMGIQNTDLPHVFDRFYRIENERTRDISGFGIGLYLSAEIVKLHKGKIWAESDYGKGSTFYFSIPICQ